MLYKINNRGEITYGRENVFTISTLERGKKSSINDH